jgi:hypothetical protein
MGGKVVFAPQAALLSSLSPKSKNISKPLLKKCVEKGLLSARSVPVKAQISLKFLNGSKCQSIN